MNWSFIVREVVKLIIVWSKGVRQGLLRAENRGIFAIDWLFELIVMNGSQMGEFGQEWDYRGVTW